MKFSNQQLRKLVEKSSTFKQRLNGNFDTSAAPIDERHIKKQLNLWLKVVGYNDQALLERRFAWDNIMPEDIHRAFGTLQWKSEKPLPSWIQVFVEALALADELSTDGIDSAELAFLDMQEPFPFEEALVPFILIARRQLKTCLQEAYDLLSEQAHVTLERLLLQQLSYLSQQTFYLEFCIVRSQKYSRLDMRVNQNENPTDTLYQAFVQHFLSGGYVNFFMEYAVLARLMSTAVEFWVQNNAEMIERLVINWPALSKEFALSSEIERVTAVKPGLSDPHNKGRSVCLFTFSSGSRIVYKPKNLGMDAAFYDFLTWVNILGASLDLQTLKILEFPNYGWVEYIDHQPCTDEAGIKRYYQRTGMLLALVYLLEGTDCHSENIVAAGEQPVLIDLETLMHPRVPSSQTTHDAPSTQSQVMAHFQNSVMRTAMLPMWISKSNGDGYDPSGLGNDEDQDALVQRLQWLSINTDQMTYKQVNTNLPPKAALPVLQNMPKPGEAYISEIIAGFEEMYEIISQQKAYLLAENGALKSFQQLHGRFVNRHTVHYFLLYQKLLQPKYLREGVTRSIQLDALTKCGIHASDKPHFWHLIASEVDSMELLDIPYFTYNVSENAIFSHERLISESYFTQPSITLVQQKIMALSREDKAKQVDYIYAAFKLRTRRPTSLSTLWSEPNVNEVPVLSDMAIEQHTLTIAQDIARQAIVNDDGHVSWIGLEYLPGSEQAFIQPLGTNLLSGTGGVALFLAALGQIAKIDKYKQLAIGALKPLQRSLRRDASINILSSHMSLGGALGLGSLLYTLTRISDFVEEKSLLDDALKLADFFPLERINTDTKLDVIDGSAGALLGLLILYERTGNDTVLQKAIACGLHLTKSRIVSETGQQTWPTINGKLLTGFSHGAAGIAYALLRLSQITGDNRFAEVAAESIEYEDTLLSLEKRNWLDVLRTNETKRHYGNTWCHGAPGIGLARLGGLTRLDSPQIQRDIEIAIDTTQTMMTGNLDTPCCGELGRNELFLVAGYIQGKTHLIEQARQNVSWMLARQQAYKHFHLPHHLGLHGHRFQLGFFHGLAGVGYHLLRALHPTLPSVLMWA